VVAALKGDDQERGGGSLKGWRPGGVWQPLRLAQRKKKSCSDYHVNGEGLPQNWMPVLMCGGVHIYGREAPRASAQEHRGGLPRAGAQGSPHLNPNQYRGAWAQHKRGHIGPNRSCNPAENNTLTHLTSRASLRIRRRHGGLVAAVQRSLRRAPWPTSPRLLPGTEAVVVRPYRYAYNQKAELEC
jgi:hypothetical protein